MPRTRNGRVDKARPNIAQNEGTDSGCAEEGNHGIHETDAGRET